LRSQMVLDQNFTAASAFGASGTPMAVLVNAEGKVASRVAAGAEEVLAMVRGNGRLSPSNS
jgi:L-lactate permease